MKGMLFPNTTLAKAPLGTVKSLDTIELDDIKRYIDINLGVENAIVVIGGDINKSEAKSFSRKVLSILPHTHVKPIAHIKSITQKDREEYC